MCKTPYRLQICRTQYLWKKIPLCGTLAWFSDLCSSSLAFNFVYSLPSFLCIWEKKKRKNPNLLTSKCQPMFLCLTKFSCCMTKHLHEFPSWSQWDVKTQASVWVFKNWPNYQFVAAQHFNQCVQLLCLFCIPSCLMLFVTCQKYQLSCKCLPWHFCLMLTIYTQQRTNKINFVK